MNKFIYFILFLLFNQILNIYSKTIVNVTDFTSQLYLSEGESPINGRYESYNATECLITFYIKIDQDTPNALVGFSSSNSTTKLTNYSLSNVYKVTYTTLIGTSGTLQIQPTFQNPDVGLNNQLSIPFDCQAIPGSLSYSMVNPSIPKTIYKNINGILPTLVKIDNMNKYSPPSIFSAILSNTPGFRFIGNSIRTIGKNYFLLNFLLYSPQVQASRQTNFVVIYDGSTNMSIPNGLFRYSKTSPIGQTNTYPLGCNSLGYWHCYSIVDFTLSGGSVASDYVFNTFRGVTSGYPLSTGINHFIVSGNQTNFKILNVLPSASISTVETTQYSFSYFDQTANNFTELSSYQVSYLLNLDFKGSSASAITNDTEYSGVNIKLTSRYAGGLILSNRNVFGSKYYGYPFGIVSIDQVTPGTYSTGNNVSVTYDMVFPTFRYNTNQIIFDIKFDLTNGIPTTSVTLAASTQPAQPTQDTTPPILNLYDYQDQGESFVVIISVEDLESGISTIELNLCKNSCFKTLNAGNLVQGNVFKGIYTIVLPKAQLGISYLGVGLKIINRAGLVQSYSLNDFYNEQLDFIKVVPYIQDKLNSFNLIESLRFSENDIDVTNNQKTIILYMKTSNITDSKDYKFTIALNYRISFDPTPTNRFFYDIADSPINSVWNSSLELHQFTITLPANLFSGSVNYIISPMLYDSVTLTQMFGLDAELRVICSNADIMPPIITDLKTPSTTVTIPSDSSTIEYVEFSFNISDSINGFSIGVIQISSNLDIQGWNKTLLPGQNIYNGAYLIRVPVYNYDIPQTYYISYVRLVDRQGHISEYPSESKVNPLMNYIATTEQLIVKTQPSVTIPSIDIDITKPTLLSLHFTLGPYNADSKIVNFTFTTSDSGSGISERHTPVVYLGLSSLDIIPSNSDLSSPPINNNNGSFTYTAYSIIPYTYGTADGIAISIYGIVDKSLNIAGYNSQQLKSNGIPYIINNIMVSGPEIVEASFQSNSSLVIIKGYRFGFQSSTLKIKYITSGAPDYQIVSSNLINFNDKLMITDQFKSGTIENKISVTIQSPDGLTSNSMIITIPATGGGSITQTPIPKCPGNPVCGGTSNGVCKSDGSCTCIPPWIGIDCLSKGSGSDGSVDPNSPTVGFNYTNDAGVYKSLIVIYSLEELDINGVIVNNYIFNNWSFVHIDDDHFQFNTSIKSNNLNSNDGIDTLTNIIVNITRFHEYKTISFAATNITMDPNSVKYSIVIDQYKFKTNLNTIRLLISTSLEKEESPNTDCQSTQFGDVADSSYIKIQIDNTVLLGRFLKRAIIDGIITTITQLPVTIGSSTDKSKSYIAMEIPNFKRIVNIDPNFSVLVDSRNADDSDPNAICSSGNKGLTTPQLVGIIVGGAVALVAISIFVGLILFRQNTTFRLVYYKLFKKGFSKKVNQ